MPDEPQATDDDDRPVVDAATVEELLDLAVTAIGGTRRDGQHQMAVAVARAVETGEHLAVQAGTGTGKSLAYLVPAVRHAVLADVSAPALYRDLVGLDRLPARLAQDLTRFQWDAPTLKANWALSGPIPWTADAARGAGTVHLGPTAGEISTALTRAVRGRAPEVPFVLAAQPSLFDPTRAPDGKHVFWAYAHVPNGWRGDATTAIESQIERFAPGFTDRVLARAVSGPAELAARNANYVGGDIACGSAAGLRALIRPGLRRDPYATGDPAVFLCSSATPPGPGVHGMSGYHAARSVLRHLGVKGPAHDLL